MCSYQDCFKENIVELNNSRYSRIPGNHIKNMLFLKFAKITKPNVQVTGSTNIKNNLILIGEI